MSSNPKTKADSEKKLAALVPAYEKMKKQYEEYETETKKLGIANFPEYKKICQWLKDHEK